MGRATEGPVVVWFRRDLRLSDNRALDAAARRGPVLPVYVHDPGSEGEAAPGAAARYRLGRSLASLEAALRARGSRLLVRCGDPPAVLAELAAQTGARALLWNRCHEPSAAALEARVARALSGTGIETGSCPGALLFEPDRVRTASGGPFRVFTPFWRRCLSLPEPPPPVPAPGRIPSPVRWPESVDLRDLPLQPGIDGAGGIGEAWRIGEVAAVERLARFLDEGLAGYPEGRDRPDRPGTSRLSPFLHFGEISPGRVWHAVQARTASGSSPGLSRGGEAFLRQLGWGEFARHLLHHFPRMVAEPLREEFARFPWREDRTALEAWRAGMTGYPLVDAGMRELRRTGWMNNRVRMVTASFLVKDLLLPWQEGAAWFLETLVDADLANNALGWQWIAGCGADAAPWFRIFNPVAQGERFDPAGEYVRQWVPELAPIPAAWIHKPWKAPAELLRRSGIALGRDYPAPIVDHAAARGRALAAVKAAR